MKVHPTKHTGSTGLWKLLTSAALFLGLLLISVTASRADTQGLVLDADGNAYHFDSNPALIANGVIGGPNPGALVGDCVITGDGTLGISSNGDGDINFIALDGGAALLPENIGTSGSDLALSQDQFVLMTGDLPFSSNSIYIYDMGTGNTVANGLPPSYTAVDACTGNSGNFIVASPFFGFTEIIPIDEDGLLGPIETSTATVGLNSNVACQADASGQLWGAVIAGTSITSFAIPSDGVPKPVFDPGSGGMSVAFNADATRVYARSTQGVRAFELLAGSLSPFIWDTSVPVAATAFGIERIAVDHESGNIFVTGGNDVTVLNSDGVIIANTFIATSGSATGVCMGSAIVDVSEPGLTSALLTGDRVIAVKDNESAIYSYTLTYSNPEGPAVEINDVVPKQWFLDSVSVDDDSVSDVSVKSKKKGKGPHEITWNIDAATTDAVLTVDIFTAGKGGKGKNKFFEPTHCGALYLDEGGIVMDEDGVLFASEPQCVAAIKDPLDLSGDGDHDNDGIPDHMEACGTSQPTDPCDPDTDGDGDLDGVDVCPLDPSNECV